MIPIVYETALGLKPGTPGKMSVLAANRYRQNILLGTLQLWVIVILSSCLVSNFHIAL